MGLYNTVQLREDLPACFEYDNYSLTLEMQAKYLESRMGVIDGQVRERDEYFCKNASIFDLTGKKLAWGDITPQDVAEMRGVYYILSEYRSYWDRHEEADFTPEYVKKNAIARIVDGQIQTSRTLIFRNYQ